MKNTLWSITAGVAVVGGLLAVFGNARSPAVDAGAPPLPPDAGRTDPWRQYLGGDRLEPTSDDDELQTLLKARFNAAAGPVSVKLARTEVGRDTRTGEMEGYAHIRDAWIALHDKPADQVRAWEFYLAMAKQEEGQCEMLINVGKAPSSEPPLVRYFRSNAEVELLLAKRRAAATQPES